MKRDSRIWVGIVLVAVVAAALWLWGSRGAREAARAPLASPAPRSAEGMPEWAEPTPAPALRQAEPAESAAPEHQPIARKPSAQLPELSTADRQALGEQALIGPHAWNRHIAPLVHPPGHPLEGTYLDGVTLDQAVEAHVRFYEEVIPGGEAYLDKPRLHIEKRFNYKDLNERRKTWDSTDLRSTREFYDWMVSQPEDPNGRWGDIWLDADPSDREATTRREFLRERLRAQEAPKFEAANR